MALLSNRDGAFNPEQAGMTSLASGYFKMKGDGRVETGKLVDALRSGKALYTPHWFGDIQIDEEIAIGSGYGPVVWRGSGLKCPIKQNTYGLMAIRLEGDNNRLRGLCFENPNPVTRLTGEGYEGDAVFSRPAAIMTLGNGNRIREIRTKGMPVGIRVRAPNRLTDTVYNNAFRDIWCEDYLFGILMTNNGGFLADGLYGKNASVNAAPQPPHLFYGTGPAALPGDAVGVDEDLPDEPEEDLNAMRLPAGIITNVVDKGNKYASTIKLRGADGWYIGPATMTDVSRGYDLGYCTALEIVAPNALLSPGYTYDAVEGDQVVSGDSAQAGVNWAACRDSVQRGGSFRNQSGHDLAIAVFLRAGCNRVRVEGALSAISYTSGAGSRTAFMATGVTDSGFEDCSQRDSGSGSVQTVFSIFGSTRPYVTRPKVSRANAVDVPIVSIDANCVDPYVELGPLSLPAGVTVDGAVLDLGRGTRVEQTIAGVPRVPVWWLGDASNRTVPTEKYLLDGSVPGAKVYTDGTRWKFTSDDSNVQSIAFTLQPVNTVVDAIVNVTVSTVNVATVKFQMYDSSDVAVGDPRYAVVTTTDGYATGTASFNKQAPATGTGYYVKATSHPGTAPAVDSNAFDTSTDAGDIFVPSDLGSALKFAADANDAASAYVSGGLVTELRHLYDSTKKLTAAIPQALLTSTGRDGTKSAVQCTGGNYLSGTDAALLAVAATADIQTGDWAMTMGFAATTGTRRLGGWFTPTGGPFFYFRQAGVLGRQALLVGTTGSIQTVGPSPSVADDSLYHVLTVRKVGSSLKLFLDAFDPAVPYASATITATGSFSPTHFLLGAYDSGGIVASAVNGLCALGIVAGAMTDTNLSYLARWTARKTGMVIPPL